jgi:hypothetical protein
LRDPEPKSVPVRARALAPLPLLFPLKQGVSGVKSAFSASIAPMKVSLGIALGAAAPLVAYGLLEQGVAHHRGATTTAAAPAVQLEKPLTYTIPAPAGSEKAAPAVPLEKNSSSPPSTQSPVTHAHHGAASPPGQEQVSNSGPGSDPQPQPPGTTTDPPPVVDDPPPVAEDPPPPTDNVTICHHTGSKKNPEVTITVGAAAVDAHLAHGDELGACAAA